MSALAPDGAAEVISSALKLYFSPKRLNLIDTPCSRKKVLLATFVRKGCFFRLLSVARMDSMSCQRSSNLNLAQIIILKLGQKRVCRRRPSDIVRQNVFNSDTSSALLPSQKESVS